MLKMLLFKYLTFSFLQGSVHKNKYTEANPINCTSVILTGGLTIYKEDIIQRILSQRLSYQKGLLPPKDHHWASFTSLLKSKRPSTYQLASSHEINGRLVSKSMSHVILTKALKYR